MSYLTRITVLAVVSILVVWLLSRNRTVDLSFEAPEEYDRDLLTDRLSQLEDLTEGAKVEGCYVYLPEEESFIHNVTYRETDKGRRINLLCGDSDFSTLVGRWRDYNRQNFLR